MVLSVFLIWLVPSLIDWHCAFWSIAPACFIMYFLLLPALKLIISVMKYLIVHLKKDVSNIWSVEGMELITSGMQEQGIKRQMYRSILLICSCVLVCVNCVHTFLPYCLSRYLSQCINYVHPLNIVK